MIFREKEDQLRDAAYLFNSGEYFDSYLTLGGHPETQNGKSGFRINVWAPNAIKMYLVSDFTNWNHGEQLSYFEETGIWTEFFEGAKDGDNYKFRIIQADGTEKWKADPFGFEFEVRPSDASVLKTLPEKDWEDSEWMTNRNRYPIYQRPLSIYEVHLSSWKHHEDGSWYTMKELEEEMIPYVKKMGYTHIHLCL